MPALIDEGAPGSLELPDGRLIEFEIRYSIRARSARLRLGAREGLVVVVPAGLQRERVNQLVASKLGLPEAKVVNAAEAVSDSERTAVE